MTHTLINPQVDRSRPVEQQDKDLAAKIVKETDAGIVINGARMVIDAVRLCERDPGHAVDLSSPTSDGGGALCVRLLHSRSRRRACASSAGRRWCTRTPASPMDYPLSVAARRGRRDGRCSTTCWCRGSACSSTATREMCNGLYTPHRRDAADHAPVLHQEPGQGRVHDGARLRDRAVHQYRRSICTCRACWPS